MGFCNIRAAFICFCVVGLILTVERQVFDFLGFMWIPIFANFLNIIFIIFGFFGAFQSVSKYLISHAVWSVLWLGWNTFLICFYSNIGILNNENSILSLGTGSVSWWEANGYGCQPKWGDVDETVGTGGLDGTLLRPVRVDGCLLPWQEVEIVQSSLAALYAFLGTLTGLMLVVKLNKNPQVAVAKNTLPRPLYTIELSKAQEAPVIGAETASLKPMTPRRVKRRSVSRGGSSTRRSRRAHHGSHAHHNPGYDTSRPASTYEHTRPTSAHSSYSNYHGTRPASYHPPSDVYHSAEAGYHTAQDYNGVGQEGVYHSSESGYQAVATAQAPHRVPPLPPCPAPGPGPPAYHLHAAASLDTFM